MRLVGGKTVEEFLSINNYFLGFEGFLISFDTPLIILLLNPLFFKLERGPEILLRLCIKLCVG